MTMKTAQGLEIGRWIVTTAGALALGVTLGLGTGAAETIDYQPGDAAGHGAADLQVANERQAAAVARNADARWTGDAAGFAIADLEVAIERETAAIERLIAARPVIELGDAGGHAETDRRHVNERQQAGLVRLFEDDVV
jgi:hypothetical protein